jgi:hypothetical protein
MAKIPHAKALNQNNTPNRKAEAGHRMLGFFI